MVTSNRHKYIYRLYKQKETALDFTILTLPYYSSESTFEVFTVIWAVSLYPWAQENKITIT